MLELIIAALVMTVAAAGNMAPQGCKQMQAPSSSLMQMSTYQSRSARLTKEPSNASAEDFQSKNLTEVIVDEFPGGSRQFMQSEQDQDHDESTQRTETVWDHLENMTLEDLRRAKFVPPRGSKRVLYSKQAAPVCGVLWYFHIGKCAGSSGYAWLQQIQALGGFQDVLQLAAGADDVDFAKFQTEKLEPLVSNMVGKLVAVHHHHFGPGLYGLDPFFRNLQERLATQGCSLVRFTLLRRPRPRLRSHVSFAMQMGVPFGTSVAEADYHAFVRAKLSSQDLGNVPEFGTQYDNHQVRYTLNNFGNYCTFSPSDKVCSSSSAVAGPAFPMAFGNASDAALQEAIRILDTFEVVGLTEEVQKSASQVLQLLQLPAQPFPRANVRFKAFRKFDDIAFPEDIEALIGQRTGLEQKLYRRYASPNKPL